jgi:hypothetical protein
VRVTFTDGSHLEAERLASRAILEPQSNEEIARKFRALTDGLIATDRQARIQELVMGLETVPGISALVAELAPVAAAAFD